jgi:glycosyltransferase involved in cell wall biosynthesis
MPKAPPFFSIIMPTYNSEATLDAALLSIVNQTFKDFEVLIIDGLSTDKTLNIAKSYQKQTSLINIFSESDKGIYDAMNKGIKKAKGTWLYFMGSDDFLYHTNTLELMKNQQDLNSNLVVYGNVFSTRFNGVYDGIFTYSKLVHKNICHQSVFFKKEVFSKIGNFNLKYKSHADWDHNIRWFYNSKIPSVYINQIIANYADNGFSSMNYDEVFEKNKYFKLITLGFGHLPLSDLIFYCKKSIMKYKEEKEYFKCTISYILKYIYRFLRKINFSM